MGKKPRRDQYGKGMDIRNRNEEMFDRVNDEL